LPRGAGPCYAEFGDVHIAAAIDVATIVDANDG
jgi:hypothetical protein